MSDCKNSSLPKNGTRPSHCVADATGTHKSEMGMISDDVAEISVVSPTSQPRRGK